MKLWHFRSLNLHKLLKYLIQWIQKNIRWKYQVALKCPNTDKVFELSSKTEEIEVLKQKDKSALSLIERIAIATYDPYN